MTFKDYQEAVDTLLLTNSTLAFALGLVVFLALVAITGLAGQTDYQSCLKGVCP